MQLTLRHKRLITTRKGGVGMGPHEARKGDKIVLLLGCRLPVILRKREDESYILIGEAYIHGIMNGEAMTEANIAKLRDFDIY